MNDPSLEEAIVILNKQRDILEETSSKLQQRHKEMLQHVMQSEKLKDLEHTHLYEYECNNLRKTAGVVLGSELTLERVVLRILTFEGLPDLTTQLPIIIAILSQVSAQVAPVIPEVADQLDALNDLLTSALRSNGVENFESQEFSEESRKVLEESGLISQYQLKERFPDFLGMGREPVNEEGIMSIPVNVVTAVRRSGSSNGKPSPVPFEDKLLDYIRTHKGEISLSGCCYELSVTAEVVRKGLEKLQVNGKIVIE